MIDEGLVQGMQRFAAAERAALGLFPKATHSLVCVESSPSKTRSGSNSAQLQTGPNLSQEPD